MQNGPADDLVNSIHNFQNAMSTIAAWLPWVMAIAVVSAIATVLLRSLLRRR